MQLILKTETTADMKTKMSLKEDKFEKCVADIIPIVRNGDLSNGDISIENNESGDRETHKVELMTADGELEKLENDVVNSHADIETPVNKYLEQADNINVINNKETVKNEIADALSSNKKNNDNSTKSLNNEAEREDISKNVSDTDLNICNIGDKVACESVIVEEKCPENAKRKNVCESVVTEKPSGNDNRELAESNDSHNLEQSFTDSNEKVHTELATVDKDTEISDKTEEPRDLIQSFAVDEQTETSTDRNATELCNDSGTEDESLELSDEMIDTKPIGTKQETELNDLDDPMEDDIIITMDRNGTNDDIIKNNLINIDSTAHISVCEEETIEKDHTEESNEKLVNDEQMITDNDCIVNFPEGEMKTNTCEATDEKQDANQIKNTENGTPQISEHEDKTIEKEHTAASNEKLYKNEEMMTDSDSIIGCLEDEMKPKTCDETDKKQHSNQTKNTENETPQISESEDVTIEKEPTAASNEMKINVDERMIIDSDSTRVCPEDELKTTTCEKTGERQDPDQIKNTGSESDHSDHIVSDEMDVSEESKSVDLKNLADDKRIEKNGSRNKNQSLHKNTKITDSVENKTHSDGNCGIEDQKHSMNVDDDDAESSEKVEREINLSTSSAKNPSHFNGSSDRIVTIGCSTNESAATRKEDTVLVPDISDDFIFNVDNDDKEKSSKVTDVNEVETTEKIAGEDIVAENIILPETKTPESSEDIIDLDETVSKCVTSDFKTPDQDSKKLHESTMEKISVLNPPSNSDDIIDLNEPVTKPISSESKMCHVNSNERQDDSTEKISGVVSPVLKLSNTLDILSDDEEVLKETNVNNKCINIEDDDDIMLIDDDTSGNESKTDEVKEKESEKQVEISPQSPVKNIEISKEVEEDKLKYGPENEEKSTEKEFLTSNQTPEINDKVEPKTDCQIKKPLLQEKFLKNCKKNLADMTREELEEFCVLKIVESILDRSNLSEIRTKLKTMTQNIDDYKKKAMVLEKQARDLQLVLKSVQDEQEKGTESIVPLKITRSVGMQVMMGLGDKQVTRRKTTGPPPANKPRAAVPLGPRPQKPATPQKQSTPQIPVPRLVPANNPTLKSPTAQQTNPGKIASPVPNGIKTPSPVQKGEKRSHNRIQSVTVDLTDDEPPTKIMNRAVPVVPPVRLVPSQNLLAPPRQQVVNSSPRKVYIPISGPQGQSVRPGQTIMLKTVPSQGARQRCPPPHMVRMPQTLRMPRPQGMRHPAPLPDCVKQYQPPNWKALPPAPDLKLAKVENGIVISWKIEGYQEDSYEEIASYQLYAYQETSSPPNTALWKKIGDVKALPLPMACTLTQFMAGYKYYFAVRALDIRSRLGPFSLPGSILLLNKM